MPSHNIKTEYILRKHIEITEEAHELAKKYIRRKNGEGVKERRGERRLRGGGGGQQHVSVCANE